MFVQSNRLRDILPYFKRKLASLYEEREIESIFFLVCHTWFKLDRGAILNNDIRLTESDLLRFKNCADRLLKNEPVQYILGEVEFYGLQFNVNSSVLIPRPETEELVDYIVNSCKTENRYKILDIGTGSGCIALSLKSKIHNSVVHAMDVSGEALEIARQNAQRNNVSVDFILGDILNETPEGLHELDIIVSNPPYIPQSENTEMSLQVTAFEPGLALFVPDTDPLLFYRKILEFARDYAKPDGVVWFELHEKAAKQLILLTQQMGFKACDILLDLSGKNRFARIKV